MTTGNNTYDSLGVPLYGDVELHQKTSTVDHLTLTAAATNSSGRSLVVRDSAGTEKFALGVGQFDRKLIMGTVALAQLASNASEATVALAGLTTNHAVQIFLRASTATGIPHVYPNTADKLGYGPGGVACAAMTVNYLAWLTA